uniref:uncharacterized protein LOC120330940 n=1 Tax=Styela clava TaxID=7725 RepID=UPI00193A4B88|nr:uncharacterized protein LOC120330940 [Styela clava]
MIRENIGEITGSEVNIVGRSNVTCSHKVTDKVQSRKTFTISKSVKLCVYTKVSNPYVVIYDSTTKFAKPIVNIKLRNIRIEAQDSTDEIEARRFRIYPNMSDDVIIFQALTKVARDDWIECFKPLICKENSDFAPVKMNRHTMKCSLPALQEVDEPTEEVLQTGLLKAPGRGKRSRIVRRTSLTGIGGRTTRRIGTTCPSG